MRAVGRIVFGALLVGSAAGWSARPVAAQMALPGAVAPSPVGATQAPKAARPKAKPKGSAAVEEPGEHVNKGAPVTVPGLGTLAGKVLALNGGASHMTFGGADKSVTVAHISLTGEKISNRLETCRVDVAGSGLAVTSLGRPNGLDRYQIALEVCPIAFDVLEGAILIDHAQPACLFKEADCSIPLAGLWGPAPADLGPDKVKFLEHIRALADAAVRANYKALTASTKDRPAIMGFAHEQAQFSSSREETCRDYADEGRHGYCSAKLTEARAARLHDEVVTALDAKAARKAAKEAAKKKRT